MYLIKFTSNSRVAPQRSWFCLVCHGVKWTKLFPAEMIDICCLTLLLNWQVVGMIHLQWEKCAASTKLLSFKCHDFSALLFVCSALKLWQQHLARFSHCKWINPTILSDSLQDWSIYKVNLQQRVNVFITFLIIAREKCKNSHPYSLRLVNFIRWLYDVDFNINFMFFIFAESYSHYLTCAYFSVYRYFDCCFNPLRCEFFLISQ